jgi:hydroxymethylbilane synthase
MKKIKIAARSSPLSRVQVDEVHRELATWHNDVVFEPTWVKTIGDIDKKTSLRGMNKTDFFTREVDNLVLDGSCRLGIHSAKDLPEPLAEGLFIVAITRGIDSSDVLVLRKGLTIDSLPKGSVIATSSERREESVRQLRSDLTFIDVRGSIGERLAIIEKGPVVGLVVAKAALLRLGFNELNEIVLPGTTAELQGQLAVVARIEDKEMENLFACIDCGVRV